jgi:hypothetical protein
VIHQGGSSGGSMSPVWDETKKDGSTKLKRGATTSRGTTPTTLANLKATYKPSLNRQGSTSQSRFR